ncbi:MAG: transglutaminase domain-containing protein [Armatimonadota bacterium]
MLLELTHQTVFEYSEPVSVSYLEFRQTPLTDSSQHLLQHRQRVVPQRPVRQYVDALGNTVSHLNVLERQTRIEVAFDSLVQTYPTRYRGKPIPPPERAGPAARMALHDFLQPTELTRPCERLFEFARPLEPLRRAPVEAAVEEIRAAIHTGFRYEPALTTASSPIQEFLEHGGGVCQDYAHLMLTVCRHLGFAARYVSGYVLPDPGEEDAPQASHAWCEVFDPDRGWLGVDPTHNAWVEERYVRLGVGRDFRDVPPNRGVFRGGGTETLHVFVRLRPVNQEALSERSRAEYLPERPVAPSGPSGGSRKAPTLTLLQQAQIMHQQQQQQQQTSK